MCDDSRIYSTAMRQPRRRSLMVNKVEVREGETIQSALHRFRKQVSEKFARSWYKSRVGYYEKPSTRKRRKRRIAEINRKNGANCGPLKMKMGLTWLCQRKRPWP